MKRLILILVVALVMVFLLNACGDMTGMSGYVSASPSPAVTLVPAASPSASPKTSEAPKASASPKASESPMPSADTDSTAAPDTSK